jgi:hypothetical protein
MRFWCLFLLIPTVVEARTYGPRPYVIVTTGKQWPLPGGRLIEDWMRAGVFDPLRRDFDAEVISNSWNCYPDGSREEDCAPIDDGFIRDLADDLNSLPAGRPIILVGHSYGADSLLRGVAGSSWSFAPPVTAPIFALATIDPTSTAGVRVISTGFHVGLPSGLGLFFNRWQRNSPVPWNYGDEGRLSPGCTAQICDEAEHAYRRNADGGAAGQTCGLSWTGWGFEWRCWPERSTHHTLVEDAQVQAQLLARLSERLERRRVLTLRSRWNGRFACAEGGGGGVVDASRDQAFQWEHFGLSDLNDGALESGDRIQLASHEGYFLRLDDTGRLRADLARADDRATFRIWRVSPARPTPEIFPGDVVRLQGASYVLTATDGTLRGWNGLAILGQWDFVVGGKLR